VVSAGTAPSSDGATPAERVVRVVPDVAGIAREFDYLVPAALAPGVRVGTSVRIDLGRRRVSGWVVADGIEPPSGVRLRPITAVRGWGPPASVVALARWAAWRWAGPLPLLLRTASAPSLVRSLPDPPSPRSLAVDAAGGGLDGATGSPLPGDHAVWGETAALASDALSGGTAVVRLAPTHDPFAIVEAAAARMGQGGDRDGSRAGVLVLVPSRHAAEETAARLRRSRRPVALLPEQWGVARAGAVVAVGTRSAALAPLSSVAAVVVLDAHDQSYHEERAPTWAAWEVAAERARRDGAPCVLVSPCPTLDLLAAGRLVVGSRRHERSGWPSVEVVDRRQDDPRSGLYSPRLVELVRWAAAGDGRRVLCVLNRTGRVRLLACAACGELARCERCGAAVERRAAGERPGEQTVLWCRRCDSERPEVCTRCGSTRMRALRVGVSRVREELEALAGTAVAEVSAQSAEDVDEAALGDYSVVVGTEAVLHRRLVADGVAFLDFDAELLAPRLRAGEQALALLARAAAALRSPGVDQAGPGSERAPGRLLVQTRQPQHPAVVAALRADPAILAASEAALRAELRLPPVTALAVVSGPAAGDYGRELLAAAPSGTDVRELAGGAWSVLAPDHDTLADVLAAVPRPSGRLRVEVDPVRD
jgi:primosomal protein N' (replication factor Y)